ncbi:YcxB family protein [Altererythrobacter sp. RZ02]|uniref:YcxB family protein n=1 Tax=Pontixanthobacter rizhaonensis TaxID=2730337 RepID=A0A848QN52_9SPHN|nr:YcxB family protein [Pontixanthobacter rizhaonensis]NMW31565.1 YcxB family protein [Pontixanthobacter rizhaonensis]
MPNSSSFQTTHTEQDVVAAALAFQRLALKRRPFAIFVSVIVVVITAVAWLLARDGEFLDVLLIMAGSGFVTLGLMIGLLRWVSVPLSARRQFRQSVSLGEPVTFSFDEDQIELGNERSHARFAWDEFHRWHETEDYFMLYQSAMLYNILPKRDMSEEQVVAVRSCLESKGPQRA